MRVRRNGNLELQRRGRSDFDFNLGAHFSSHSEIVRRRGPDRQPRAGDRGWLSVFTNG